MAVNLSLYTATPYTEALNLPPSQVREFFESQAFKDWKKSEESRIKINVAVVNRLNEVIRGLDILAKGLRRR